MFDVMSVYLGDRLGLYRCLRDDGPATPPELAGRAGIHPRYAREWLEQQAVTGFLEVDDVAADADTRRYTLPEAFERRSSTLTARCPPRRLRARWWPPP